MHNTPRSLALFLSVALFACNKHEESHEHTEQGATEEHGHTHEPLIEGGALIELGDHEANLEVHLNAESGELVIYLVDGHATDYVRSSQPSLLLSVEPEGGTAYTLTLNQVESALSGEKLGDSSKYRVQDERLKGSKELHGKVATVSMMGSTYKDVEVAWPAGEHDHDH